MGQKVKDSMRVLLPVLLNKSHDSYDKIRSILLYIFSTNGKVCFIQFRTTSVYNLILNICDKNIDVINLHLSYKFSVSYGYCFLVSGPFKLIADCTSLVVELGYWEKIFLNALQSIYIKIKHSCAGQCICRPHHLI